MIAVGMKGPQSALYVGLHPDRRSLLYGQQKGCLLSEEGDVEDQRRSKGVSSEHSSEQTIH